MAYRTADHERWKQLDFIMGQEVHTSKSHKCDDICDQLTGKYPKEFKFVGWHPQCLCFCVPLLSDKNEINKMIDAFNEGKEYTPQGDKVTKLPSNFTKWVDKNADRIEKAQRRGSLPYFLKENEGKKFGDSKIKIDVPYGKKGEVSSPKTGRQASKRAFNILQDYKVVHNYSESQMINFKEIKKLGFTQGKYMSFDDARGVANYYNDDENCSLCVVAHELRLRGFNISASRFPTEELFDKIATNTRIMWKTKEGKVPEFILINDEGEKKITASLQKHIKEGYRYHLGWDIDERHGHIITVQKIGKELLLYDPQIDEFWSVGNILEIMKPKSKLQLLRVDNLNVNTENLKELFFEI